MLMYILIMRYFGHHPEKGGYWYSFRNLFIVLFILITIGTGANLFDSTISWEGLLEMLVIGFIIYGFNLMCKKKSLTLKSEQK